MMLFAADTETPFEPVSALTVLSFNTGTLVVIGVNTSCFSPRAVCVAYVELMSTPFTCNAVALSVAHVVVAERVFSPVMV